MNKLQEAIQFAAEQVQTAESKLADGFQGSDLLGFVGAAMQAPALVSKENRAAIVEAWKETKASATGMADLRSFIQTTLTTENKHLEGKIEKGAILLFDTLDFIGEFKAPAVESQPSA